MRKTLEMLTRHECRYFIEPIRRGFADEALCCAEPVVEGCVWCPEHLAVVFLPETIKRLTGNPAHVPIQIQQ